MVQIWIIYFELKKPHRNAANGVKMTNLMLAQNQTLTMSTREIASLLNKNHTDIKRSAARLFERGLLTQPLAESKFEHNGNYYLEFNLNKRDSLVLVAQNSPEFTAAIVDRWQELESKQQPQLSQIEILAQSALALVEHEKKLNALEQSHAQLENKLEQLKESTAILPKRPTNAESVCFIRMRINKKYSLPPRIVNDVLYGSPYAPKPAGQVRNNHEQAGNATYTVWYSSDVTKLFARFVSECQQVTKTQAVHPSIDGRFKLVIND